MCPRKRGEAPWHPRLELRREWKGSTRPASERAGLDDTLAALWPGAHAIDSQVAIRADGEWRFALRAPNEEDALALLSAVCQNPDTY
jgi:hypothetical protein